ncbi:MAG: hypothetical protein JWQ95_3068 [Sphaerisporangium sp.]|nr:hypothetical protein [Sphaerisporangium sp.]
MSRHRCVANLVGGLLAFTLNTPQPSALLEAGGPPYDTADEIRDVSR